MKITNKLENLNKDDLFSIVLFALYKLTECPEYSTISELCYVLDRKNLLKLCEYFGGSTIRIPTISEIEEVVAVLLIYQYVTLENMELDQALEKVKKLYPDIRALKTKYATISKIIETYNFNNRYHVDKINERL